MALWGNNDNVGAAGSVTLNYATKTVTGAGTSFGETAASTQIAVGDIISFGVKTKPGTYFGDAVVTGITSFTVLSIGSTANLSGAAIAATSFQASQKPKFTIGDSKFSERNSDYSSHIYGVAEGGIDDAQGGQYATAAGWVGVTTYTDTDGNLRVKKEVLCAMSGITTGNTPTYPNIETAN